jgi:hypothetical protein
VPSVSVARKSTKASWFKCEAAIDDVINISPSQKCNQPWGGRRMRGAVVATERALATGTGIRGWGLETERRVSISMATEATAVRRL